MSETEQAVVEKAPEKKGSFVRFLVTLAIFAWFLRSLIVAPFVIPSGSMLPTMWVGDYLFVAKWPYGYSRYSFMFDFPNFDGRIFQSMPERGDVVVFRPPGQEESDFVKRLIGLPGDTIEMRNGTLVLNGKVVKKERMRDFVLPLSPNSPCEVVPGATRFVESDGKGGEQCRYPAYLETLPTGRSYVVLDQVDNPEADYFGPVTVPEGHVFMMGDNRDDSLDSRFSAAVGGVGFVPMDHLVGRAMGNFWSTDGSASWIKPWTWFTALRASRLGISYSE